jgi:hypothetical protein
LLMTTGKTPTVAVLRLGGSITFFAAEEFR